MTLRFKNTSTDVCSLESGRTDGRRKIFTGQKFSSCLEKDAALRAEQFNIISKKKERNDNNFVRMWYICSGWIYWFKRSCYSGITLGTCATIHYPCFHTSSQKKRKMLTEFSPSPFACINVEVHKSYYIWFIWLLCNHTDGGLLKISF